MDHFSVTPCPGRRTLIREASYTRCPKRFPIGPAGPRVQADDVATLDFATFNLQPSSQTLPVFPPQMSSGPESPGTGLGSVGKEPQGHDAEHRLLTHTAFQGLGGFLLDECLEGSGKMRIYFREGHQPWVKGLPPSTQSNQLRIMFFLTSIFLARSVLG